MSLCSHDVLVLLLPSCCFLPCRSAEILCAFSASSSSLDDNYCAQYRGVAMTHSLVGMVVGIHAGQGLLDTEADLQVLAFWIRPDVH